MMRRSLGKVLALAFLPSAIAQAAVSRTCPSSTSGICFSLSIPDQTAQSGNGDIFLQVSGPATSHEWIALGQGQAMSGSNMFVMYLSADGMNVTVSPRLGTGHTEPQHEDGQGANITLLEGSGVENGTMTANVRCAGCSSWDGGEMNFAGTAGSWIYASRSGTPIQSDDLASDISYHDDHGVFNWDFANAKGGELSATANPFLTSTASEASTQATGGGVPDSYITAHAVFACLAVAFILPIGGILIRVANLPNLVIIHSAIQYLGLAFYIVAFGLGAYYASEEDYWSDRHPIIGTVVFGLMLTQPLWGIIHHHMYKKTQGRTISSWFHLSVGRIVIVLGIVNGGLGLQLGGKSKGAKIGYGVGAGIMGLLYILAILYGEHKRSSSRRIKSAGDGHMNGDKIEHQDSHNS
ncbi:Cytochrome b561 and DOMON domain-containing protein [Pseudocercospora fuligena]|uniref:Cytochrome b561 and DOMON domain-containing protein n=1 Tax=Pseudocercospora fuligena TaxID=685502 RepID=A0A8H6VIT3_9PEZI|nr:Cytochrome b561 and DOMON domain-containing protein [Pseudocercospora fuligena]